MRKWHIAVLIAAVMVTLIAARAIFQALYPITNRGIILGIGVTVYSDLACTQRLDSIDWGTLQPGGNKTASAFIKNTNTTNVQLSLQVGNWTPPEAESNLTLTWTYANETLRPSDILATNFTLCVSPNVSNITSFTFLITIWSREATS